MRPELSVRNDCCLERHRYYELKHFCLQYPIWHKASESLDSFAHRPADLIRVGKTYNIDDPVGRCAEAREAFLLKMRMAENAALETDEEMTSYILAGVTEGLSYEHLLARFNIPCCKDTYYKMYRRFFWLLNRARN